MIDTTEKRGRGTRDPACFSAIMLRLEALPEAYVELSATMRACDVSDLDDDALDELYRRVTQVQPQVQTFLHELAAQRIRLESEKHSRRSADLVARAHPDFVCPISHALMRDPVLAADGHSYERRMIEEWFARGSMQSPMTNAYMTNTRLFPEITFKKAIKRTLEVQMAAGARWGDGAGEVTSVDRRQRSRTASRSPERERRSNAVTMGVTMLHDDTSEEVD